MNTDERINEIMKHYDQNTGELKECIILHDEKPVDDGEEKKYLLLYNYIEDDVEIRTYEYITGRRNIYKFLKELIIDECGLNVEDSTVILSTSPVNSGVSVYKFLKIMETRYPDDNFSIDNYVNGDI